MKALIQICTASLASALFVASAAAQPAAPTAAAPAAAPTATTTAAPAAAPTATTTAAPAAAPTAAPADAAAAQPAPPPADQMPVNSTPDGTPGGTSGATPATLKETCMAAINNDQQWTDELAAVIEKTVRFKVHNEEAELIAMNKRHVVMAYAVLWLFSIGFLFAQWRRQQALKQQIESLKSDLAAAIKGPTA